MRHEEAVECVSLTGELCNCFIEVIYKIYNCNIYNFYNKLPIRICYPFRMPPI